MLVSLPLSRSGHGGLAQTAEPAGFPGRFSTDVKESSGKNADETRATARRGQATFAKLRRIWSWPDAGNSQAT